MAPRKYTQSSRAASTEQTRTKIVAAAVDEYRERGIPNASLQSIAGRADVSRGTILNHFGDADGLLAAVVETAVASIELPDEGALDGASQVDERARRFAIEMLRFYERTEDWWHVFAGERDELPALPALQEGERRFWVAVGSVQEAALGNLARDPSVLGAMAVLVAPNTVGAIKAVGLDADSNVITIPQTPLQILSFSMG